MGVIDIASSKSVWRGMEYYKQNKVLSYTVNEDGSCEGIVAGSGDGNYHVHVDMEHPRKSTCDCPLANGKKIICKPSIRHLPNCKRPGLRCKKCKK